MTATATKTTSAPKTIKLSADTQFVRDEDGWEMDCTLLQGTEVTYRREQSATWTVHVATWIDDEGLHGPHGAIWTSIVRTPHVASPAATAAPAPRCQECQRSVITPGCPACDPTRHVAPVIAAPVAPTTQTQASADTQAAQDGTAYDVRAALGLIAARQVSAADADEQRVRRLAAQAEMLRGEVYQVNYYIPTDAEMDNPSRILRRHGFRLDGSNWVMPAKGLEHKDVQKVKRQFDNAQNTPSQGRKPYMWVIKYTREQLAQMRDMAQERLAEELRGVHTSLIERIDSAAERLREAQEEIAASECPSQKDREKATTAHTGALRATINEACERFQMCLKGAEIFDDTGSLDALFGSVRDVIRAQATAVNATLRLRGVKTVTVNI